MKSKIIVLAAATFCSFQLFAQTHTEDKTTFGVRAGINFQNMNGKDDKGDKFTNDLSMGFHIGANAEIPVGTGVYVQPGVVLTTKGSKDNNVKTKLSYIDIPVNLLYKPVLGTGKMLLGFGPYVGFGVGGKVKLDGGDIKVKFAKETTSESEDFVLRRMDAGANFLAGYEFSNRFSFQLNAQLGLVNVAPKVTDASNDKTNLHHTIWGFSVGYRF